MLHASTNVGEVAAACGAPPVTVLHKRLYATVMKLAGRHLTI